LYLLSLHGTIELRAQEGQSAMAIVIMFPKTSFLTFLSFCFHCLGVNSFGRILVKCRGGKRSVRSDCRFDVASAQELLFSVSGGDASIEDDKIPRNGSLFSNNNFYDDDDDTLTISTKIPSQSSPLWEVGNTFDQFLNQCTIQSFLYLLKTCHDPQTVIWLENFTQPSIDPIRIARFSGSSIATAATSSHSKLLTYHGLAAMNLTAFPTWDNYFYQLLEQPKVLYCIESYQSFVPSYELEINPSSLCTRLISVREQIAREFSHDLRILYMMQVQQLMMKYGRETNETSSELWSMRSGPSRFSLASDETLFLDSWDATDGDYAMPSPLRKGNFDLLLLLTTQESIHRILNNRAKELFTEDNVGIMSKIDLQYLNAFYLNRVVSHFSGRQLYGRANHFLQELVAQPMTDDQVDALHIVQYILATRQQVAREWSHHAAKVSDLHIDIKRAQFSALMKSYDTATMPTDNTNSMQ
jgi:hypothetical protein